MTEQELRLKCLEMALYSKLYNEDPISVAQDLYEWINPQPIEDQTGGKIFSESTAPDTEPGETRTAKTTDFNEQVELLNKLAERTYRENIEKMVQNVYVAGCDPAKVGGDESPLGEVYIYRHRNGSDPGEIVAVYAGNPQTKEEEAEYLLRYAEDKKNCEKAISDIWMETLFPKKDEEDIETIKHMDPIDKIISNVEKQLDMLPVTKYWSQARADRRKLLELLLSEKSQAKTGFSTEVSEMATNILTQAVMDANVWGNSSEAVESMVEDSIRVIKEEYQKSKLPIGPTFNDECKLEPLIEGGVNESNRPTCGDVKSKQEITETMKKAINHTMAAIEASQTATIRNIWIKKLIDIYEKLDFLNQDTL